MVGQRPLKPLIVVRIHVPQQSFKIMTEKLSINKTISKPENTANADEQQITKEEIVSQVIELQKQWNEYVTEQSPDFILKLYEKNLLRFELDGEGKIMVVFYIQPLNESLSEDDPQQVLRIGGLTKSSSEDSKRAVVKILNQLKKEVLQKKWNIIAKTDNDVLSKFLKNMGMEEFTFEECKQKYRNFTDLYLKMSQKREEEYLGKKFYIKVTH